MISILTPTFNRFHTLKRLYDSLCSQDCMSFEWVIIDDGSTDDTKDIIDTFKKENKINIKYIFQENKGKPGAINSGVPFCCFDYILIVDSDDALTKDAISSLIYTISEVDDQLKALSGVGYRKATFDGQIFGERKHFKESILYLNATEAGNVFKGDLAYCFKKEYLLRYPFPFYKNEKFVPELFVWNKITDEGKIKFHTNKIIYLAEFLDDGLTKNFTKQLKKYPYGFKIYYADQMRRESNLIRKIKMMIRYFQCLMYGVMK